MKVKRAPIITAHAEQIGAGVLREGFLSSFREAVGRRAGIYVLYSGKKPYYIGLASSLRGRLKQHTKDHLEGKWSTFSFFEVGKGKYLKDLESLSIRIAQPTANRNVPDFCKHRNIKKEIKRVIVAAAKAPF